MRRLRVQAEARRGMDDRHAFVRGAFVRAAARTRPRWSRRVRRTPPRSSGARRRLRDGPARASPKGSSVSACCQRRL